MLEWNSERLNNISVLITFVVLLVSNSWLCAGYSKLRATGSFYMFRSSVVYSVV